MKKKAERRVQVAPLQAHGCFNLLHKVPHWTKNDWRETGRDAGFTILQCTQTRVYTYCSVHVQCIYTCNVSLGRLADQVLHDSLLVHRHPTSLSLHTLHTHTHTHTPTSKLTVLNQTISEVSPPAIQNKALCSPPPPPPPPPPCSMF